MSFQSQHSLKNPSLAHTLQKILIKQLTPSKWKDFMIRVLETMLDEPNYEPHTFLLKDIRTIVNTIPESSFIQSVLEIQPFKPQFVEENILEILEIDEDQVRESTIASSSQEVMGKSAKFDYKGGRLLPQKSKTKYQKTQQKARQNQKLTQKTLTKQFNKAYHPYHFLFKNFSRLLQLKYKKIIQNKKYKIDEIKDRLRRDMDVFSIFMRETVGPLKKMFKVQVGEDQGRLLGKMKKFIEGYVRESQVINHSLSKIMVYAARCLFSQHVDKKFPDFISPQNYDIPPQFLIDGSYLHSLNTLLTLSQTPSPSQLFTQLIQLRSNILADINQYYTTKQGQPRELQLNAEIQLEIIRYIVEKLKCYACQIFGRVKGLEVVYGDQIAYKFQEVSFMYTQLVLAYEIVGVC